MTGTVGESWARKAHQASIGGATTCADPCQSFVGASTAVRRRGDRFGSRVRFSAAELVAGELHHETELVLAE